MLKPANTITILVATFAIQLLSTCNAVEVLKKQSSFSKGQLMLGPYSFKDGNLVYSLCDREENNYQCKIVQEKPPYNESTRSCNITLVPEHKDGEIQSSIAVAALGQDKVVIFWHDIEEKEEYLKIDTIQMDSCKVHESKVSEISLATFSEIRHTNYILTYNDDTFDVLFPDIERCGDKMCKMTFDAEGKITTEPAGFMTNNKDFISFASPIATRSPTKGFVYTRIEPNETTLWSIKPDGTEKQLSKYSKTSLSAVSASNGFITSCIKAEMKTPIVCTQYNEQGSVKFTKNLASIDEQTQLLRVHSLAKGGFLIMTAKCETGACSNAASSQIIRVDADGKEAGTFRLIDFESAIVERHWAHIYQTGEHKYCAAFVGEKRTQGQMEHLNVVLNCFGNADFKK